MLNGAAMRLATIFVDDGYRVIVTRPIDSARQPIDGFGRQNRWGVLQRWCTSEATALRRHHQSNRISPAHAGFTWLSVWRVA
jgi:hypothetical protein